MTTIDLTAPASAPDPTRGAFDGLPRRLALTLPELQHLARAAGDAPLPFEIRDRTADPLEGRLGQAPGAGDDTAYDAALAALADPTESLARRGLLVDGVADPGALGAIGLLATPRLAVDIDLVIGDGRARAWHRQSDGAVACLATVDGIVFELVWFDSAQWASELARVAVLPTDHEPTSSAFPAEIELPFELLDAVGVALRDGRGDLVPPLVRQHLDREAGTTLTEAELTAAVTAFHGPARGRMRCLVARVDADTTTEVGVVSWLLLPDGWRALTTHRDADEHRVTIRSVEAADLPTLLAPVLTEVSR